MDRTFQVIWKASQAVCTSFGSTEDGGRHDSIDFIDNFRYHAMPNNPYSFPSDDQEIIRLDIMQYVMRTYFGGNVKVPISEKATQILDVGTGSG